MTSRKGDGSVSSPQPKNASLASKTGWSAVASVCSLFGRLIELFMAHIYVAATGRDYERIAQLKTATL